MKPTSAKITVQLVIFVVLIVVMSAVSIWLGTGPVVLSP
jgi:CHASE3 domain sensor protein